METNLIWCHDETERDLVYFSHKVWLISSLYMISQTHNLTLYSHYFAVSSPCIYVSTCRQTETLKTNIKNITRGQFYWMSEGKQWQLSLSSHVCLGLLKFISSSSLQSLWGLQCAVSTLHSWHTLCQRGSKVEVILELTSQTFRLLTATGYFFFSVFIYFLRCKSQSTNSSFRMIKSRIRNQRLMH